MTSSYHSTHSRRLSQQSFNTSVFYSPPTTNINTNVSDGTTTASASSIGGGSSNPALSSTDSLFSEWISETERDEVIARWRGVLARDIMETKVVIVNADTSVEEACDTLLSEGIECLVIIDPKPSSASTSSSPSPSPTTTATTTIPPTTATGAETASTSSSSSSPWIGLFDFSDVNAFLTLAATRHTLSPEIIKSNERLDRIVEAAKAGRVDVRLVSDFSDKNPYVVLPHDANLVSVLEVFARGAHRVFIENSDIQAATTSSPGLQLVGMISDKRLLSFFSSSSSSSSTSAAFQRFTSKPLYEFSYPLLNIHRTVAAASSVATVIDAMRLMSEEGVSSVAVVDEESGLVIGGVSVTDIGRVVVPSQSNQILGTPLKYFVTTVKLPDGSTDGADKYPVYSVFPSGLLVYTIEKLLATNARRLFVTDEEETVNPTMSLSSPGNLTGVISILDVLSLFAHLARIPDVDPRRMQRHRRASSTSSQSSRSERELSLRPRSNSRASVRKSPSFGTTATAGVMSSPASNAATFSGSISSGASSPVGGMRGTSPVVLGVVPDIGSALGGSVTMAYAPGGGGGPLGRRGSMNASSLRARKRDSIQRID